MTVNSKGGVMLKKVLISAFVFGGLWMLGPRPAFAAGAPPVQNQGAVIVTTSVAVSVTTTPAIALSTGTNMWYGRAGEGTIGFTPPSSTTVIAPGQYMRDRVYTEFFNDTSTEVWIGYNAQVTTTAGVNYGRRLLPGSSWAMDGSIQNFFLVCGTTWTQGAFATEKKFVITQQR